MSEQLQRKFIATTFRIAKFGGAIAFVWGIIEFVDSPRSLYDYFNNGMLVIVGYFLSFGGAADKMIATYGPKTNDSAD